MMKEMESSQKEDGLSGEVSMEGKKSCAVCKTTKTPLWRSGPSSLCNACGIRHRKKQPISPEEEDPDVIGSKKCKFGRKKKKPMLTSGLGVNLKRLKSPRRQWGEVERAALLLMALSCGAVFA